MTFARCDRDRRLFECDVELLGTADEKSRRTARAELELQSPAAWRSLEPWRTRSRCGFLIVVPVARPFQKLGAGRSKPTMSFPDSFVGGELCADAVAVTATTAHAPSAARMMRLTIPSLS